MLDGGTLPLANVRDEHHSAWNMFLKTILNKYWPVRDMTKCSAQCPPPLAMEKVCSHPIADPDNALSLELAAMVACGRMEPDEAIEEHYGDDDESTLEHNDGDDDESESESDFDFDESEMNDLRVFVRAMAAGT